MTVRLVVPDDYNDVYGSSRLFAQLRDRCDIQIYTTMIKDVDDAVQRIGDAEVIVANRERTPLHRAVLERLPNLKLIAQTGFRGAHLDLAAATERGILVSNTAGVEPPGPSRHNPVASTIELTVALMLATSRRIPYGDAEVRAGRWSQFVGRELAGRQLGILGFGRIGTSVAKICQAIGMEVSAWGPTLTKERAEKDGATFRELDDLLGMVDVLSIHLQLSPLSRGLLSREKLALMKPSAMLINTARGPIVDEAALADALREGRLWAAGLDVFGQEPLPPSHPFTTLPNVVLTPHIGWVAQDGYEMHLKGVTENIQAYLDGGPVPRMMNPEALGRRESD